MADPECRLHNAAVPLRHYRLDHVKRGVAYEVAVDFYSPEARTELLLWTSLANRMRVKIGGGAYQAVGETRGAAVDLGAFSADEVKAGTLEISVPIGVSTRHERLAINLGIGL